MKLSDLIIPPQIKLALKLLPFIAIAGLAGAFLWQRASLIKATDDLSAVQKAADEAIDDNELLAKQADTSAAAARQLAGNLQTIRTRYDHVRTQLASIPASECFDGRLPDAAIGLLSYAGAHTSSASADAGQPKPP